MDDFKFELELGNIAFISLEFWLSRLGLSRSTTPGIEAAFEIDHGEACSICEAMD